MSGWFTSKRERWLWLWTVIVVVGIYATLEVTPILAGLLRDQGLIATAFWVGLWLIALAVVALAFRLRPGGLCKGRLCPGGLRVVDGGRIHTPMSSRHLCVGVDCMAVRVVCAPPSFCVSDGMGMLCICHTSI